jgi:hypothetical protein
MFFKKRFTKWLPIIVWSFDGNKFLLQGRKNLWTGKICFKNTRINKTFTYMHNMPENIFDPKEQLEKLLNKEN